MSKATKQKLSELDILTYKIELLEQKIQLQDKRIELLEKTDLMNNIIKTHNVQSEKAPSVKVEPEPVIEKLDEVHKEKDVITKDKPFMDLILSLARRRTLT